MKRTRVLYALFTERTCNYGNESFTGDNTVRDKRLQLPSIMYFCVWNKRPCANIMERKWVFALGQINIGHLLSVSSNGFAFTIHSFLASFHKDLLHLINNCRRVEKCLFKKVERTKLFVQGYRKLSWDVVCLPWASYWAEGDMTLLIFSRLAWRIG